MITRYEIRQLSEKNGVPAITIDKDWVLGHIVAGIYHNSYLKDILVFKGGTCLKKCFFENYRFSEDLDFTAIKEIDLKLLRKNFKIVMEQITDHTDILFQQLKLSELNFKNNLMAYRIDVPFWGSNHSGEPTNRKWTTRVKIEITLFEKLCFKPVIRNLIHSFSDTPITDQIKSYSLEEIIAEKLRAILQRSYSAPRDYYDLWYLTTNIENIDWKGIKAAFIEKCDFKNIRFNSIDDFFVDEKIRVVKKEWNNSLKNHLKDLPDVDIVMIKLKKILTYL